MRGLGRFPMVYYPLFGLIVGAGTFGTVDGIEISMTLGIVSLVFVIGAFIAYCIHKFGKNDKIQYLHQVLFSLSLLVFAVGVIMAFSNR